MAKLKLTDSFIRNHKTPEKRTEVYDKLTNGLALRVTETGHKSFVYRYRFGDKVKRYTIGTYPAVSLSRARDDVRELNYMVSNGTDPLKEKQEKKKVTAPVTFKTLAEEFKELYLPNLRDKTKEEHTRIIDNELIPAFGKYPAKELTRKQIISVLDRKAIKQGKKTMANRIRARLHSIYEFGVGRDMVAINPVSSVPKYPEGETKRDRYYSENEIREIWKAFNEQDEPTRTVFKILLICGQRSKETRHMKWDDIHRQEAVWTIPTSLSKSKRAHDVPLSDFAMELIESLRPVTGKHDYVFNSPVLENQPIEWVRRSVKKVRTLSDVSDFRLHDLRRTAATYMAKLSVERTVLGKILNHKGLAGDGQVTAIYDRHSYMDEKRQALQRWSDYLKQILDEQTKAKIFNIR